MSSGLAAVTLPILCTLGYAALCAVSPWSRCRRCD